MKISDYLDDSEIACRCGCGLKKFNQGMASTFDRIRKIYGKPITINCGCRCTKHNADVGGEPDSAHLPQMDGYCTALDCQIKDSHDRFDFVQIALSQGISRIGIYETFVHIDINARLPQHVMWYGVKKGG
jgi:zinc D-Ala-D-Ala carboxypeptidase